jgi:hypothetical protein
MRLSGQLKLPLQRERIKDQSTLRSQPGPKKGKVPLIVDNA